MVVVTENWLRTLEGDNELMVRDCSFFRIDGTDGRIGGGIPILGTEKYSAQEGHKLHIPNL